MKKELLSCAAAVVLAGCADRCSFVSKCTADAKLTPDEIAGCEAQQKKISTACFKEGNDYTDCTQAKQVCNADHMTDGELTATACQSEFDKYQSCILANAQ